MARGPLNHLVVEGNEDKFAVIQLMKHHIDWPAEKEKYPVHIELGFSADEILAVPYLSTKLKSSEVKILGVILDADEEFASRWQRLRNICEPMFPTIPAALPKDGLVVENDEGQRLGIWIMPDNASHGMLETFIKYLVPVDAKPLLKFAETVVKEAKTDYGAPYIQAHVDKALVHTWLAWQDPPGEACGRALTRKVLDAKCPVAQIFSIWFKRLYELKGLPHGAEN